MNLTKNNKQRSLSFLHAGFGIVMIFSLAAGSGRGVLAEAQAAIPGALAPDALAPSIFGVEMPSITDENGLDKMVQAGAYWVRRNGLLWADVEPTLGARDWNASLDAELQDARSRGMQVILNVHNTPGWAQLIPGKVCGPIDSSAFGDFANFMHDVVDRYSADPYFVNYYEIWNEPDVDPSLTTPDDQYGCWGDEEDDYYGGDYFAEMLKVVYPAIKAANPNAQVLIGGLLLDCDPIHVCPNDKAPRFLEGILLSGGGNFFEGVSFHAYDYYNGTPGRYGNPNWGSSWNTTGPAILAKANFLRNMLAKYGVTGKYLLNTESALLCDSGCDDGFETTKAYYLAQAYAAAIASNLQANIWYATQAGWRNSDLFDANLNERPAYFAYRAAQARLVNAAFVEEITRYPGVKGYAFWSGERRIWVLWSLDGNTHTVELPEWPEKIYAVDGDVISNHNPITVNLEPKYIEWPATRQIHLPFVARDFHLILNGDFDLDADANGSPDRWRVENGGNGLPIRLVSANPTVPAPDPAIPIGKYSLLLGSPDYTCTQVPQGFASVRQTFKVPLAPDGAAVRLTFKYAIYSQDASTSDQFDRFEVRIDDSLVFWDGNQDNTNLNLCNYRRVPGSGWATGQINLVSPVDYRGKAITISFENWSRADNFYNTFTYLDDVRVEISN